MGPGRGGRRKEGACAARRRGGSHWCAGQAPRSEGSQRHQALRHAQLCACAAAQHDRLCERGEPQRKGGLTVVVHHNALSHGAAPQSKEAGSGQGQQRAAGSTGEPTGRQQAGSVSPAESAWLRNTAGGQAAGGVSSGQQAARRQTWQGVRAQQWLGQGRRCGGIGVAGLPDHALAASGGDDARNVGPHAGQVQRSQRQQQVCKLGGVCGGGHRVNVMKARGPHTAGAPGSTAVTARCFRGTAGRA